MTYEPIDIAFLAWAEKHELEVFTHYHESEVRTVFVQGSTPERGQIWVDPPASDGSVVVHAAIYRKRGKDNETIELLSDVDRLEVVLDEAYSTVVGGLHTSS